MVWGEWTCLWTEIETEGTVLSGIFKGGETVLGEAEMIFLVGREQAERTVYCYKDVECIDTLLCL